MTSPDLSDAALDALIAKLRGKETGQNVGVTAHLFAHTADAIASLRADRDKWQRMSSECVASEHKALGALLKVRVALGLHIDSNDDLVKVANALRAALARAEQTNDVLRRDIAEPSPDIQEAVLRKLAQAPTSEVGDPLAALVSQQAREIEHRESLIAGWEQRGAEQAREIARLQDKVEQLRIIANVNGDWTIKYGQAVDRANRAEQERDALRAVLLRWLQAHNKMDGKSGLSVAEFDVLRQETHAAINARQDAGE